MSLYVDDRLVCRFGWNEFLPNLHRGAGSM